MNSWHRIISFIILGLVAIGCSSVSTSKATDVSITSRATKTPTLISTPSPSVTSKITRPTTTRTQSSTVKVTATTLPEKLVEVATIEAIVTEKPELGEFYSRFCIISGYSCNASASVGLSPNKEWAVFFIENNSGGLSFINVNSKKQWNIYYHDIKKMPNGCDCTVEIEHWSPDGRFVYVSPRMEGDGGLVWFWHDDIELIRINLENGSWMDTKMGATYSFSPNEKYIAYRRGQDVVIYELQTGKEQTFSVPAEYAAFGRFVWSPDNKNILFIGSSDKELLSDEGKPNGFTLFLLNTENMKSQVILEKDERYLYPLEWQTSSIILLESLYKLDSTGYLEHSGEKYKLDLSTNEISKLEAP